MGPDRRRGIIAGEPGEESLEPPEGSPRSPGGTCPLRRPQLPGTQLGEVGAPRHAPLAGGLVYLPEQSVIDRNQHLHALQYIRISKGTGPWLWRPYPGTGEPGFFQTFGHFLLTVDSEGNLTFDLTGHVVSLCPLLA